MKKNIRKETVDIPNITIENARIAFRNFEGKEGRYNPAGRRNFCVFLDSKVAEDLARFGWNIKWLKPRDPEEGRQAYIQVTVSFKKVQPKIVLISSRNKAYLKEDTVHILDWAELKNVDLIIRPYQWDVNDKSGVKAYLKTMYVTLIEDEFEAKYVDVPDAAIASIDDDGD